MSTTSRKRLFIALGAHPRLWGLTRDDTISGFEVKSEFNGKMMEFLLEPLQSEPNLWKLQNANDPEDRNQAQREVWMVTQQGYTKDLVQKEDNLKTRKIHDGTS